MFQKDDFFRSIISPSPDVTSDISGFSALFAEKAISKDSHFIRESEENVSIGFVSSGIFRSYILDYDGKEAIFRFITRGELLSGGFAFLHPSPMNIQALTDAAVYTADWTDVADFCKANRGFMKTLNGFLSKGSFSTTRLLSNFIRLNAKDRYLLFAKEYPQLLEQIPHYHIANHLGISSVQLSRIRKSLRH